MVDDLKGRLDAVLARKDALDKAAAAKTKQTQCAQDKKCEAEGQATEGNISCMVCSK